MLKQYGEGAPDLSAFVVAAVDRPDALAVHTRTEDRSPQTKRVLT